MACILTPKQGDHTFNDVATADSMKAPGSFFTSNLSDEIAAGPRFMPRQTQSEYGEMLHELHQHLQRLGGG